jgi:coenzyme F420-0:L-glutamate ligase
MNIAPVKTRIFLENEDLIDFIVEHIPTLTDRTVLAVTSKIVALAEGRTREPHSPQEREQIIKEESEYMIRTEYTWLTIKDGTVMASAGVDESNADGKLVLLPKDSFAAAETIRTALKKKFKLSNLGIVITDSRILPLRAGIVGVALGYAGFKGVRDYRDTKDIFGRPLRLSRTDIADGLATAAVLEMGEGAEQQPLAIIENPPVQWSDTVNRNELKIDIKDDLYRPLFEHLPDIQ